MRKYVAVLALLLLLVAQAQAAGPAHNTNVDDYGCHQCGDNCPRYGLEYGQYHCHPESAYNYVPENACLAPKIENPADPGLAAPDLKITVGGQPLVTDVAPHIKDGSTLVPLRAIFDALGGHVTWNPEGQAIMATVNGRKISLIVGDMQARVGKVVHTLAIPPVIAGDRTLVPLRFVSEAAGAQVAWDGEKRTITITAPSTPPGPPPGATRGNLAWIEDRRTIQVAGVGKVRFIGLDVPGAGALYNAGSPCEPEAMAWMREALIGQEVFVEYDAVRADNQGNTLAWVWTSDGQLLNEVLVAEGYAKFRADESNKKYAELLQQRQAEAVRYRRGLWQREGE